MRRKAYVLAAALMLGATSTTLLAAADQTAVDVLFESRHLDRLGQGSEVTYRFERQVSNERLLGAGFADDIRLGVTKVNDKGEREVEFKVFTGEKARDPSNWPDLTINPIFIWYLDRAVAVYGDLAGGNHAYLKDRFKQALRDKAQIEQIKFTVEGKEVDALRVSITPFSDDVHTQKMQGFEISRFTMIVSNDVPGYFADLVSEFSSQNAGAPQVKEHISYVSMGAAK